MSTQKLNVDLTLQITCPSCTHSHTLRLTTSSDIFRCPETQKYFKMSSQIFQKATKLSKEEIATLPSNILLFPTPPPPPKTAQNSVSPVSSKIPPPPPPPFKLSPSALAKAVEELPQTQKLLTPFPVTAGKNIPAETFVPIPPQHFKTDLRSSEDLGEDLPPPPTVATLLPLEEEESKAEEEEDFVALDEISEVSLEHLDTFEMSSPTTELIETLGKYEVRSVLGGGSFGVVYRGYDTILRRYVAIKKSKVRLEGDQIEAFKREAETLAQVNHPNIVQIYDFDVDGDQIPYIVMEFVSGEVIQNYLRPEDHENKEEFLLMVSKHFAELADALAFLHQKNIYHQDIKPSNIMVCTDTKRVKLLDFGLAIQGNQTLENFEGTCRYCAPERFGGNFRPSITSDIYALGLVLFRVLTGRDAYPGKKVQDIIKKVQAGQIERSFQPGEAHEALQNICFKCTEFKPEDRYQDAMELHLDLVCYVSELSQAEDSPYLYLLDQRKSRILFPLSKRKYYIGRAFGNDLIIQDDTISRVHAVITKTDNEVTLTNFSKTSSIKVNKVELFYQEVCPLSQSDFIKMSHYVFFYVPSKKDREQEQQQTASGGGSATKMLSLEKAKMLLMAEDQELYQMIQNGELKGIQSGSTISVEMNSLFDHIERKSGHRKGVSQQQESNVPVQIRLTLYDGKEAIKTFAFEATKESIVIGRSAESDVPIDYLGISRQHCQIIRKSPHQYILKDLKSNNGTFIHNQQIEEYDLENEDHFYLGKFSFKFQKIGQAPLPDASMADPSKSSSSSQVSIGMMTALAPSSNLQNLQKEQRKSFLIFEQEGIKNKVPLEKSSIFFGSDPSCEFYLKGWGIKPKQAIILKEGIEFRLINLIEGKGVLLNGKKVKDVLLKDRDRITVADYDYEFCIELTP